MTEPRIYLRSIHLERFGRFHDTVVGPFSDRMNIVLGANEAGKTTVASFVGGVLFGWEEARGNRNTYKPEGAERAGSLLFARSAGADANASAREDEETFVLSRARNADGLVVMYADSITPSMRRAIDETERRREKQDAFNKAHGIVPRTVIKSVRDLLEISAPADEPSQTRQGRVKAMSKQEKAAEIARLEKAMKEAAKMLEFELAATLRDQIIELRGQ